MRYLKTIGFIFAVTSLPFFTACGLIENSQKNSPWDAPRNGNGNDVSVTITQATTVRVGETKSLTVTRRNTDDFTLSVSPASGSGCVKNGNNAVTCKPTAAGEYTVTVTAVSDTSKKSNAKVTVPELEIFGKTELSLYADETESEEIIFNADGNWTATASDSFGNIPAWITLNNNVSSLEADYFIAGTLDLYAVTSISGPPGNNSIKITLLPNDSGADRTATVTIATASRQMTVTIIQRYVTKGGTPYGTPEVVTIAISPATANVTVGESVTFSVTTQNTNDFTLSISPASGHGCAKSGNKAVACTPTAAGTYTITVTADADTSKKSTATITAAKDDSGGEIPSPDYNPKKAARNLGYNIGNNYDTSGQYLNYASSLPTIVTRTNEDGTISVAVFNNDTSLDNINIYEYSDSLELIKIVGLKKELPQAGAFTRDSDGNYYVFYAKEVDEGAFTEHNMAIVKYGGSGMKEKVFSLEAYADDSFYGVKLPFRSGACRMEIAGDRIAVYFARQMFSASDGLNHQASYGFILNKNTLERVSYNIPYASHSFNQFILPDGDDFVFVDHGDAYPRAFAFEKVEKNGTAYNRQISSFGFKTSRYGTPGYEYNYTFAQMGGLVNTPDGYLFMGAYEKTNVASDVLNGSRNMFLLKLDKNLSTISDPIWITDYSDRNTQNVANPKITALDNGRYLVMWECMRYRTYSTTYAMIIDEDGNMLKEVMELPGARLSLNDVLRYNATTGNVHWAVNDFNNETIALYSFDPGESTVIVGIAINR